MSTNQMLYQNLLPQAFDQKKKKKKIGTIEGK